MGYQAERRDAGLGDPPREPFSGSRVPREVVQSVKEYAENEYEDAPEGTDARIVWSVILAMCNERLS